MIARSTRVSAVYTPAILGLIFGLTSACTSDKLTDATASANPEAPDVNPTNGGQPGSTTGGLVISPDSAVLQPQQVQQFTATGGATDGSTPSVAITWKATGGTMDSTGAYTAGAVPGTYQVIATDPANATADTARVVVSGSAAPSFAIAGSPCGAGGPTVAIRVGDSWQSKVNASPAGTVFCIAAGTHHRQTVVPKSGQKFWGAGTRQTIMDGDSATTYAFRAPTTPFPSNVEIHNLVIRRYTPALQAAAIMMGGAGKSNATRGWVIADNEITANGGGGIRIGSKGQVLRNFVHHNWQIGISGVGDSTLVEGNEISWNNYRKGVSWAWEAGGTKFVKTRGLIVRNNNVHDNWGPGLWTDIDNIETLMEGNTVTNNADAGIFHEISYSAVIRNNIVKGNGFVRTGWLWGGGIVIAASGGTGVEVSGNVLDGNFNGIALIQQNRGSGAFGTHLVQNVWVHDNTVTMRARGQTGAVQDISSNAIFTSRNNRFTGNRYYVGTRSSPFAWMNGNRSWTQWRGYGLDANGTLAP
jgi:parallel beta-helix repeat protein